MPAKAEVPEEAVESVALLLAAAEGETAEFVKTYEAHLAKHGREDEGYRARARCLLEAAAPAIRNQERQRVREALEGMIQRQELNSQDCGPVVPTPSVEAVLDTLKDPDG